MNLSKLKEWEVGDIIVANNDAMGGAMGGSRLKYDWWKRGDKLQITYIEREGGEIMDVKARKITSGNLLYLIPQINSFTNLRLKNMLKNMRANLKFIEDL